jgi:hypothetical protein
MLTRTRRFVGTVAASVLFVIGAGLPANAQVEQDGLVNVAVGDVTILEDVDVAIVANVVANVCNLDVNAAVLAIQEVDESGQDFTCTFRGGRQDVTISQND